MTCLPTAASPPVIECTRPTLMTSCAQALWGVPSSTAIAIAIAVTRNDLSIDFLPWTDLCHLRWASLVAPPDRLKPERCALKIALMRWISNVYLRGADQARLCAGRAIPSRIKPCPQGRVPGGIVESSGRARRARQGWCPRTGTLGGALAAIGSVDGRLARPWRSRPRDRGRGEGKPVL